MAGRIHYLLRFLDVGFDMASETEVVKRLRIRQVRALVSTIPQFLFGVLFFAAIVTVTFMGQIDGRLLGTWAISVSIVAGVYFYQCRKFQDHSYSRKITFSQYKSVANQAAILGALWGILGIMVYPNVEPEYQIVVIATLSGMFGGGVVSLYTLPRAMFYWLGTTMLGSAIALLIAGTFTNHVVAVMLVSYALSLFVSGHAISATYTQAKMAHFEVSDQSDTISILLRDFSEKASDWLWEFSNTNEFTLGSEKFEDLLGFSPEALISNRYGH